MKKFVIGSVVVILTSCSNGSVNHSASDSIIPDTSSKGAVITTDTTGASKINADTSGMGEAR